MTAALFDVSRKAPVAVSKAPSGEGFNFAAHGLRGIASIMVFIAHMLGGTVEHVYGDNAAYASTVAPFWNFGTFGVCLFFVISGFVILPSAQRYGADEFAARRFVRIYPLFFAFSLLFVVLNFATGLQPDQNGWLPILAGLTFTNLFAGTLQLTPNAWSLSYEVWFYVFVAAAVSLGVRHRNVAGCIVLGIAAALFVARFPMSLYFLGGLGVRIAFDRWEWLRIGRHRAAEFGMMVLCVFLASRGHYDDYDWSEFRDPVVPMLIVVTTLYFALSVSSRSLTTMLLGNRWVRYLGTVSYSLYLVHPYTYLAIRMGFIRAGLFTPDMAVSVGLFIVTTGAITFLVTHGVYRLLERWPYERVYGQKIYRSTRARLPDPAGRESAA